MRTRATAILVSVSALALFSASEGAAQDSDKIDRLVRTFSEVCVANAASLPAARTTALSQAWGFASTGSLPGYNNAPDMETFAAGELELVLRPNRNRFGCLLLTKLQGAEADALLPAIGAISGLAPKGKHEPGASRYRWTLAEPKGSEIVVTVDYGPDGTSTIIALESNGKPN